jgi:hypothetical protein
LLLLAAASPTVPLQADFVADQRRRHPNAYRSWTVRDDERLSARAAEGATVPELMAEFGRNRGAITSRLRLLGDAG